MKTKQLIKLLQEIDSTGEKQVVIDGEDIFNIHELPGYYDGPYQILEYDETKKNCYNVSGAQIRNDKTKIVIKTLSIEGALDMDTTLPIKVVDVSGTRKHLQYRVDVWRKEAEQREIEFQEFRKQNKENNGSISLKDFQ